MADLTSGSGSKDPGNLVGVYIDASNRAIDSALTDMRSNGSGKICSYADVALGEEETEFRVGDFVWCKLKNHPWWPGQIYDKKEASEIAIRHSQENRILVALFGDGSCSWCLPSQLIPFSKNFRQMSKNEDPSNNFLKAIQKSTDEIGRVVEANMTCKCIPLEKRCHLARQVASNAAVKPGVLVPEVDFQRLSVPEFDSSEIVSKVLNFAKGVCFDSVFDVAVLRSYLSAFYYSKGGFRLPVYCEKPVYIDGLEDKDKNILQVNDDLRVHTEIPIPGPIKDDWLSSPAISSAKSRNNFSDDIVYSRRKRKSVVELMAEVKNVEPEFRKRKRKGKEVKKVGSEIPKIPKENVSHAEKSGNGVVDGVNGGALVVKNEETEVALAEKITSDRAKDESENISTSRGRKKSKYLSSPYRNPKLDMEISSFKIESEYDEKLVNVEVKGLDRSIVKSSSDKKMSFPVSDIDVRVNELVSGIRFAAVDPLFLSKKGSLGIVCSFFSAFRSSTYYHGQDYKIYRKSKNGKKRKSLPSRVKNVENGIVQEKPGSSNRKPLKSAVKTEGKKARSKSCPKISFEETVDDLVSDVGVIRQKLEIMTAIMVNHCSRFSDEDRISLKDEMKNLTENMENASEKVRVIAEKTSLCIKES
ncbi:hypothetical protein ABFS82_08G010800 [Erythranthe guttata]|nr:PREDICTED: uncharacterized protein LOC105969380 [Erythranthe guttata]|eukprot:XP_012849592.1 PREDICTED: uncharacterized protein LOC105969380 [Erythranthe guttata]